MYHNIAYNPICILSTEFISYNTPSIHMHSLQLSMSTNEYEYMLGHVCTLCWQWQLTVGSFHYSLTIVDVGFVDVMLQVEWLGGWIVGWFLALTWLCLDGWIDRWENPLRGWLTWMNDWVSECLFGGSTGTNKMNDRALFAFDSSVLYAFCIEVCSAENLCTSISDILTCSDSNISNAHRTYP